MGLHLQHSFRKRKRTEFYRGSINQASQAVDLGYAISTTEELKLVKEVPKAVFILVRLLLISLSHFDRFQHSPDSRLKSEALLKILDAPRYKVPQQTPNLAREIAIRVCITSDEFRAFEEQKQRDDAEKKKFVQVRNEEREASKKTKALVAALKKGKAVKVQKKTSILGQATLQDGKKTKKSFVSPLVK